MCCPTQNLSYSKKAGMEKPSEKEYQQVICLSFRLSYPSLNPLYLFLHFYLPGSIPFCVLKEYSFFHFCIMSGWSLCKSSLPFIFLLVGEC